MCAKTPKKTYELIITHPDFLAPNHENDTQTTTNLYIRDLLYSTLSNLQQPFDREKITLLILVFYVHTAIIVRAMLLAG